MKNTMIPLTLLTVLTLCIFESSYAQVLPPGDTVVRVPPDTVVRYKIAYDANFDVIIKRNGDIVYGLVKEVGLELVKYQRTDIPNGPVYTIPKYEIYAISYRNQVLDILNPVNTPVAVRPLDYNGYEVPGGNRRQYDYRKSFLAQNGNVLVGIGFIRGFSKVKNAGDYASAGSSPVISIAYDAVYRPQIRLGVQLAFGSHKFSRQDYETYDSTQTGVSVKESFFTLHVYGKYSILKSTNPLQPYVLLGLGINSANIRTNQEVNFINRTDKVLLVTSGARSVGLGILARAGTNYHFNNRLHVFGDIGSGPSILNFGVAAHIN